MLMAKTQFPKFFQKLFINCFEDAAFMRLLDVIYTYMYNNVFDSTDIERRQDSHFSDVSTQS